MENEMENKNEFDALWGVGLAVVGVLTSIGAASVTGALLCSCNLSKVGGLAKLCMPLGVAGMSAAAGIMASDAIKQTANNTKDNVVMLGAVAKTISDSVDKNKEVEESEDFQEQTTQMNN
jgi:Na+/H+-dicarboxylate symporter